MKSSMVNVYLFAVGTASVLAISLTTTVAEDEAGVQHADRSDGGDQQQRRSVIHLSPS